MDLTVTVMSAGVYNLNRFRVLFPLDGVKDGGVCVFVCVRVYLCVCVCIGDITLIFCITVMSAGVYNFNDFRVLFSLDGAEDGNVFVFVCVCV